MLLLFLAAALIPQKGEIPASQRGSNLYQSCKANLRLMDSPNPTSQDAIEGRVCQAYINGFLDGDAFGDNLICVDNATVGTLSRVYIAYMDKNPKLMDEPKVAGLYEALAVGYPCAVKNAPQKRP